MEKLFSEKLQKLVLVQLENIRIRTMQRNARKQMHLFKFAKQCKEINALKFVAIFTFELG